MAKTSLWWLSKTVSGKDCSDDYGRLFVSSTDFVVMTTKGCLSVADFVIMITVEDCLSVAHTLLWWLREKVQDGNCRGKYIVKHKRDACRGWDTGRESALVMTNKECDADCGGLRCAALSLVGKGVMGITSCTIWGWKRPGWVECATEWVRSVPASVAGRVLETRYENARGPQPGDNPNAQDPANWRHNPPPPLPIRHRAPYNIRKFNPWSSIFSNICFYGLLQPCSFDITIDYLYAGDLQQNHMPHHVPSCAGLRTIQPIMAAADIACRQFPIS